MKSKNYYDFGWFAIANRWLFWALPLYLIIYYLVSLLENNFLNNVVIYGLPIMFGIYDLYIRLSHKNESILDNLTFENRGYVLHLFIFPFPIWFVVLVITIVAFDS